MSIFVLSLYKETALHFAASYGHVEAISDLISAGTAVNTPDEVSITPAVMQECDYPSSLYNIKQTH